MRVPNHIRKPSNLKLTPRTLTLIHRLRNQETQFLENAFGPRGKKFFPRREKQTRIRLKQVQHQLLRFGQIPKEFPGDRFSRIFDAAAAKNRHTLEAALRGITTKRKHETLITDILAAQR